MTETTVVHLVRHGEVENPTGILYGRLPDFHLSEMGRKMAERVAEWLAGHDVTYLVSSPLERAQETMQPIAARFDLEVHLDDRLLEATNHFEGFTFGAGAGSMRHPRHWRYLWNPFRPSWGEAYTEQMTRVMAAVAAARDAARGHEAVCVTHQLPIWVTRCHVEGRRLWHDPRKRQCSLASITSLTFADDAIVSLGYAEPARDLVPSAPDKTFDAGA
jgi:broad specificity phosphatase PhoE